MKFGGRGDKGSQGGQMPLMEHLAELRRRLVICAATVIVAMVVVLIWFYNPLVDWLLHPLKELNPDSTLLQTDPLEGFNVRLKVAGYAGVAVSMPVLLWQTWRFISPGLYNNEKRYAVPFVGSALALFAVGAGLAYWTLPRALEFLGDIGGDEFEQHYQPSRYLALVTYMMLAFGVGFQIPVLLVFLQLAGVVQPGTLRKYRRHAIVGIAVLAAVITPSGDPQTMMMLVLPMYVFYELAILIGSLLARRKARTARR